MSIIRVAMRFAIKLFTREHNMKKIKEIQKAIENLNYREMQELRQWFIEKEWSKWDKEIRKDSAEGKLDFLIDEAKIQTTGIN